MTEHPVLASKDTTVQDAAELMRKTGCGCLPVGDENNLEGMITDRDIVMRVVASGKGAKKEKISKYMTSELVSCHEDDSIEEAAEQMQLHRVKRLIVKDKEGKVTGILSFGGVIRYDARAEDIAAVVKNAAGPF